jgi:hypothetical protein
MKANIASAAIAEATPAFLAQLGPVLVEGSLLLDVRVVISADLIDRGDILICTGREGCDENG